MTPRFYKAAEHELDEAVAFYDAQVPGLGARYRAAVREALSQIERFPKAGTRLSRRTRRRLVNRFPYGIVYRHTDDGIFVVAIAHLHRKPEYWRDRLR